MVLDGTSGSGGSSLQWRRSSSLSCSGPSDGFRTAAKYRTTATTAGQQRSRNLVDHHSDHQQPSCPQFAPSTPTRPLGPSLRRRDPGLHPMPAGHRAGGAGVVRRCVGFRPAFFFLPGQPRMPTLFSVQPRPWSLPAKRAAITSHVSSVQGGLGEATVEARRLVAGPPDPHEWEGNGSCRYEVLLAGCLSGRALCAEDPARLVRPGHRLAGTLHGTVLKTVVAAMSPWVQIPHPPQANGP